MALPNITLRIRIFQEEEISQIFEENQTEEIHPIQVNESFQVPIPQTISNQEQLFPNTLTIQTINNSEPQINLQPQNLLQSQNQLESQNLLQTISNQGQLFPNTLTNQ